MRTWLEGSVIANKIISFSGRTSFKQLETISDLEGMKQFHGCEFPRDSAVLLSLLTNLHTTGETKHHLHETNKQKVANELVTAS